VNLEKPKGVAVAVSAVIIGIAGIVVAFAVSVVAFALFYRVIGCIIIYGFLHSIFLLFI